MLIGFAVVIACGWILAGTGGCAAAPPAALAQDPPDVVAVGDADDIEPALLAAAPRLPVAIESRDTETAEGRTVETYRLRDAGGQRGWLRASYPVGEDPREIRLTARFGLGGDPVREGRLLGLVERRLGQLRGRDAAPIRW